jgi:hypothetical protein
MPIKNSLPIDPIYRSSRVYDSDQKVGKNEYKFEIKKQPELNSNLEKPKKDKKEDPMQEKSKIFV